MARNEFDKMSPEERREMGRRGGIASGEAKRAKKAMKERLEIILEMPLKSGKGVDIETIQNFAKLKGKNITVQDAMMIAQIQKALKGDTNAAVFVRDTAGQNPTQKVEAEVDMDLQIRVDYGDDE